MNYEDWESRVPEELKGDSLWKMEAYRLALFLSDIGWQDVTKLLGDKRTRQISSKLGIVDLASRFTFYFSFE